MGEIGRILWARERRRQPVETDMSHTFARVSRFVSRYFETGFRIAREGRRQAAVRYGGR
jgi:hypothetical protein